MTFLFNRIFFTQKKSLMGSGIEILKIFKIWWRDPGSNWGHTDFQSVALPTELSRRWGVLNNLTVMSSSPLCMFLFNSLFLQQIDNIFGFAAYKIKKTA